MQIGEVAINCITPSLRRNYPVQVQRVISQPSRKIPVKHPEDITKVFVFFYFSSVTLN